MNIEDLNIQPNSHKYKAEQKAALAEKKVEKVVKGKVKTKKKSEVRKFADVFISEDAANVKSYVVMDVLIPAVKKAISDIITNGIDMILYGGSGGGKKRRGSSDKVSYRDYYDDRNSRRRDEPRTRSGFDFDTIILDSRSEADDVLSAMDDLISNYGVATVGDYYDLVGVTDHNWAINKYGWTNLRNAEIAHARGGGYIIKLPRAMAID